MCNQFEPNKLLAAAKGKCPQCQSGKMFKYSVIKLNKFTEMFVTCPFCGLRFELEPGYFWGAMYVSYAITTGIMLVVGALVYILFGAKAGFWGFIIPIFTVMFLSMPFTYRYARVFYLHFFSPIRFNKELSNKK